MSQGAFVAGITLVAIQVLAAIPWLLAAGFGSLRHEFKDLPEWVRQRLILLGSAALILIGGLILGLAFPFLGDPARLQFLGRWYGALLHIQVAIDLYILAFIVLLAAWPKGGAVASAAFRESLRQPMFWFLTGGAYFLLALSVVTPYFTMGDDYKMMKQLGFDIIMLAAAVFCILAAAKSIHDEIEGKTAITLLSKPVTRRQFLLGKYIGILAAGWFMTWLLGWGLNWALYVQPSMNRLDDVVDNMPLEIQSWLVPTTQAILPAGDSFQVFGKGIGIWFSETLAFSLGLLLGFGKVMVLLAIAAALASRLPLVANVNLVIVVYLLGHLASLLVQLAKSIDTGGGALGLVSFLARAFETVLPALNLFNMSPVIIREAPIPVDQFAIYVTTVFVQALIYTTVALLFGLILFEDRDLA